MKVIFSILLILAVKLALASSSLFINTAINVKKVQNFKKLYDQSSELKHQPSGTVEDKLSVLIKNGPLLSVQSIISLIVSVNLVAEAFSIIPTEVQSKVRTQACWWALGTKLMTTLQSFEVADFPTRDQFYGQDLYVKAKDEIGKLVASPLGMSTAYLVVVLATRCRPGSTVPYLIGEVPSLLRFLSIVCVIAWPKDSSVKFPSADWLFQSDSADASGPPSSIDIDKICDNISCLAEMVIVSKIAVSLVGTTKGGPIRGFTDMLLLSARLLVIQNFLCVRVGQVLRSSDLSAWVSAAKNHPLARTVISSWPVSSLQPCAALVKELWSPTTRISALRRLLGRHNIAVVSDAVSAVHTSSSETNENSVDAESTDNASTVPTARTSPTKRPTKARRKGASKGKASTQRRKISK